MADNIPFGIILPFEGKMVIAIVQQLKNPVQHQFFIKFPSGYKNTFIAWEPKDDDPPEIEGGWAEETLGITELSKDVGEYLDEYIFNSANYFEPVTILVKDETMIVHPKLQDSEMHYRVYRNGELLFVLCMGETNWEADTETDEKLLDSVASAIEERYQ